MQDIQSVNFSQSTSNVELSLKAATALGFKGEFDPTTSEGTLKMNGIEVAFSVGGENLYFSLANVFVKSSPTEGLQALMQFLNAIANYGGQARTRA